jgi:hypothetical protein
MNPQFLTTLFLAHIAMVGVGVVILVACSAVLYSAMPRIRT